MAKRKVKSDEVVNVEGVELTMEQVLAIAAKHLPKTAGFKDETSKMTDDDRKYASHQFRRILPTGEEIVWSVKHSGFLQCLPDLRFSNGKSIPGFGGDEKRWEAYSRYFSGAEYKADLRIVLPLAIANKKRSAVKA